MKNNTEWPNMREMSHPVSRILRRQNSPVFPGDAHQRCDCAEMSVVRDPHIFKEIGNRKRAFRQPGVGSVARIRNGSCVVCAFLATIAAETTPSATTIHHPENRIPIAVSWTIGASGSSVLLDPLA